VRIVLLILGIWLLINVLFVVVVAPAVRRKYQTAARRSSDPNREAYPFDGEQRLSLRFIIISVAMTTLFSLSPPITGAAAAVRRAFRKRPPSR
jgi:hypothetical protein